METTTVKTLVKRNETSIRISSKANGVFDKLVKSWGAKSKVLALEKMIGFFEKMGINPFDTMPETLSARLEKRVNQIIAFIRENEKRQLLAMERVIEIARDKLSIQQVGSNTTNASRLDEMTDILTRRLSLLGDKESILSQVKKASIKYSDFLIHDIIENPNSPNKNINQSPAVKQFLEALDKIFQ